MTREEAKAILKGFMENPLFSDIPKVCRAFDMAIKALEQEPKWIPCSERLPKDNGYYLTTTMYHEVYCDYWEEERFNRTETVIAWMPLPEPYEPTN